MERVGGVVEAEEEVGSGAGDGARGGGEAEDLLDERGGGVGGLGGGEEELRLGADEGEGVVEGEAVGVEPEGEAARGGPASAERGELAGLEGDLLRGAVVDAPAGGLRGGAEVFQIGLPGGFGGEGAGEAEVGDGFADGEPGGAGIEEVRGGGGVVGEEDDGAGGSGEGAGEAEGFREVVAVAGGGPGAEGRSEGGGKVGAGGEAAGGGVENDPLGVGGVAGSVGELRGEGGGSAVAEGAQGRAGVEDGDDGLGAGFVEPAGLRPEEGEGEDGEELPPEGGGLAEPAESAASLMGGRDALEKEERADAHLPRPAAQEVDGEHDRQPEQGPKGERIGQEECRHGNRSLQERRTQRKRQRQDEQKAAKDTKGKTTKAGIRQKGAKEAKDLGGKRGGGSV